MYNSTKLLNNINKMSLYKIHKNSIPCNLDVCTCVINLNINTSYVDRFLYKKCFDNVKKFTFNHKKIDYLIR